MAGKHSNGTGMLITRTSFATFARWVRSDAGSWYTVQVGEGEVVNGVLKIAVDDAEGSPDRFYCRTAHVTRLGVAQEGIV